MPKTTFLDKFLKRIEKVDRNYIVSLFSQMTQEHSLLETILNSLQEGVIVADKDLKITFVNEKAIELIQSSMELCMHCDLVDFFLEIGIDEIAQDISENKNQWLNKEIEILRPNRKYLRINTMPVFNERGIFFAYIVFIADISKDRDKELETIKNEKLAVMKVIAAGIAHEIGNPLNSLDIHLQLLERSLKSQEDISREETIKGISILKSEIRRLDRIVSNFLSAVRPEKPEYKLTGINDVIRHVVQIMRPEIESFGIKLDISFDDELPKTLVDENQLKQAFSNLIKNAVQAMQNGGTLSIKTFKMNEVIRIELEDTGKGIPPEMIKHIFEPYITSKPGGSGLGLMITDRIIHQHSGKIGVKSSPGEGTTFTIDIPVLLRSEVRMLPEKKGKKR